MEKEQVSSKEPISTKEIYKLFMDHRKFFPIIKNYENFKISSTRPVKMRVK